MKEGAQFRGSWRRGWSHRADNRLGGDPSGMQNFQVLDGCHVGQGRSKLRLTSGIPAGCSVRPLPQTVRSPARWEKNKLKK